jgi:multidrug efflux pump subunit AcrB
MLETSVQAQFLIPMVVSLSFGVMFATGVTLVLVPALYLLGDDLGRLFGTLSRKGAKALAS